MFEALSGKLTGVFDRLRRRGALSEEDVAEALREVRLALLDADVALPVVRDFIANVRTRAVGQEVLDSVSPAQQVVKIVHDCMIEALGGSGAVPLNLNAPAPLAILMVGLQGSGKTTTSGKLGLRLSTRLRRRVLLASLDVQRPAAQLQLQQLATQVGVSSLPIVPGEGPLAIAARALDTGRREGYDVVVLDTAGRLSINAELMEEVRQVRAATNPAETLLVVDAMTGQDAVNTAKAFNDAVGVTGIVMTRMDGDARGGAALSMRQITGAPIKLVGIGEKLDALEEFHPERVAGRILGQGDVISLVEKAAETIDEEEAEKLAQQDGARRLRPGGLREAASPDHQDGQPVLDHLDAARCRQDPGPARSGRQDRSGQDHAEAPGGDHRLDDAQGAQDPGHHQGLAQEAHRGRVRNQRAGREQAAEAVRRHVHDDEAHEQARPEGPHARRFAGADARQPATLLNRLMENTDR